MRVWTDVVRRSLRVRQWTIDIPGSVLPCSKTMLFAIASALFRRRCCNLRASVRHFRFANDINH